MQSSWRQRHWARRRDVPRHALDRIDARRGLKRVEILVDFRSGNAPRHGDRGLDFEMIERLAQRAL